MITSIVDTIQMKSNYAWNNCNHDNIAIRSHIMIYNSVKILIFATKCSSIFLADMCLLYQSHQIARLLSHLIQYFSKRMFTV